MAAETKQTYASKELDAETYQEEKSPASKQVKEKGLKRSPERIQNGSTDKQTANVGVQKFVEKEKDNVHQREAVIRPQQAGKIDFKSLQNRSKFSSDGTWPSGKSSPQSPSGKGRNRDKGKRSGKTERGNPQKLYSLSINNPRANPTIGIAYPQQKLSPPKKLEASRGPISGSYRFHVPSIPEREAELQQEVFGLNRCFQEGSTNLTSPNYTSQPAGCVHQPPPSSATPQQPPGALEPSNTQTVNQMLFPDFQLSAADMWPSPDRTFNAASFTVPSQKSNNVVEMSKPNSFVPLQFQYGYQLLDDAAPDSFPCDQNTQDLIEATLGSNQVNQNSFSFQPSSEERGVLQNPTQLGYEQSEDRAQFSLNSKAHQYVQTSHGVAQHCTRSSEEISSSECLESSNHQSEKKNASLSDKSDSYHPADSREAGVTVGGERGVHPKNVASTQLIRFQGNVRNIRNIAQDHGPQMHFSKKTYSSPPPSIIPMGTAPHDKSHSRVAQPWEGHNKAFTPSTDQNSTPYPFQCQPPLEQRQSTGINSRVPWQQIRLSSAMPNQNRTELSRTLSNQQMAFLITQSDWKEDSKTQKGITQKNSNIPNNRTSEPFTKMRQDDPKQKCNIISHCPFTNKVDSSQSQIVDAKSKSLYFGVNHPRTLSYPPLHVPTMDLMMVSPYESPTHSPIHNQMSTSTCSSLSPNSTSPASSSSDDSSNSKVSPPQFYNQHQGKASMDHLSSIQHQYHLEALRGLHYNQEKVKDNILGFSSHRHAKSGMESGKGLMDNYLMEPHPPPPYSAHQLLASSLANANLDQLDVLLTCKQCDKNFNNLTSFLDHKLYCGQAAFAQNDFKDVRKFEDPRKSQAEHTKAILPGTGFAISKSSSDLHLSLLGLNRNGEIMSDNEPKVDTKDDPLKLMLPSAPLPDLEMEDARLDSLITEALNGLVYQSDNAEIDSSFMDAFGDDEIATTKCSSNKQPLKTKDTLMFESRSKQEKYSLDSDFSSLSTERKRADIGHSEKHKDSEQCEEIVKNEASLLKRDLNAKASGAHVEWVKKIRKSDKTVKESERGGKFQLCSKFSGKEELKPLQSTQFVKMPIPQSPVNRSPSSQRPAVRDGKRKRISGGSWSKELIHKIVQQKNKLHKLHVKGTKNMQFSLVMERVTPTIQNPTFREYDYVSDSDEECEPVKIASQGRLSQSIRCKYTYTKECKGRITADKQRESPWRQDRIENLESKKAEAVSPPSIKEISGHQRVRRRSSRSSTSSELSSSVSISSESISSPKSADRTDSDSEKKVEIKKRDLDLFERETSPKRIVKESSTSLALTFTKNTKHYSTDKILLSELKDSYTTSKCSNVISTTEETAEHKLTKSTVSLARFKTTRVEVEKKMDHYGCEIGLGKSPEEPTPLKKEYKDHLQASMHLSKPDVTLNPGNNNTEINHLSKSKRDNKSLKGKHKKKEDRKSHKESECSSAPAENFDDSLIKETKTDRGELLTEPQSICSSLINEVCLSPAKLHDAATSKDRNCLLPYSLENEQSLMKSPLSFDTSSMFGDLTDTAFDNNLYPDIQLTKEGFSPIETSTDKKELFETSFSPLLEQRDWSMIVDVTPELPDEIAQYKEDSDSKNDKKSCYNNVPFPVMEKLMEYHPNLTSCVSVDELEIKRIVTELESHLQSAKPSSPSQVDIEPPKHLTMSKFSPLRLDHESQADHSTMEAVCPGENLALAPPTDSHSELFSENDLPWASPVQFELMSGQQCLHTPTHPTSTDIQNHLCQENLDLKSEGNLNVLSTEKEIKLNFGENDEGGDSSSPLTSKSEEMLEHEIYTENLMKSLEVISDSLSSGLESPQLPLQQDTTEEHDKQEVERLQTTNQPERMDSSHPTDLNKDVCPVSPKTITQDICESTLDNIKAHYIIPPDRQDNEIQPANTCKRVLLNKDELPSDKTHLPGITSEHKPCEAAVNPDEIKPQTLQDFHLQSFSNSSVTSPDRLADKSLEDHEQERSQDIEMFKATNTTGDHKGMLQSGSAESGPQVNETETEIIEQDKKDVDCRNSPVGESNESVHSGDEQLHGTLKTDADVLIITRRASKDDKGHEAENAALCTALSTSSPSCEESLQINVNEDSKLDSTSSVTPYVSSNCAIMQTQKSPLPNCWGNIDILSPALTEDPSNFKNSVDECESLTPTASINISTLLDSKLSSPRTLLAVDGISTQAFCEPNDKTASLAMQNSDTVYEFKLSPISYNKTHFSSSSSLTSDTLSKGTESQPNIKSSPTDGLDVGTCALNFSAHLSPSCRLSPIHVQNELELSTYDHFVKLDIPHFPDMTNQVNMKYPCIPATHHQGENRSSDGSEQPPKQVDAHTCPDPIDYMNLQMNLLSKTENPEHQISTFKPDVLILGSTTTSASETVASKVPEFPMFSTFPTSTKGQSIVHLEVKSSPKKSAAQNTEQGKFQCEICLLYFRTAPGLKRHKAMKHSLKSGGNTIHNSTLNTQESTGTLSPTALQQPDRAEMTVIQGDQPTLDSASDGAATLPLVSKSSKNNDIPAVTEKAKKNKIKRSRSMDINNEGHIHKLVKQDPFPDELLSILKTDILQAISPDFALPENSKSLLKENTYNSPDCWTMKVTDKEQNIAGACVDVQHGVTNSTELYKEPEKKETVTTLEVFGSVKKPEMTDQLNIIMDFAHGKDLIDINAVCNPSEDTQIAIKCETTGLATVENSIHCEAYKNQPISPTELGPDLKALFDDENTFSQLFPRNDEMKRKKCARVYGKSNKKQKQMSNSSLGYTGPKIFLDENEGYKEKADHIFVSGLNDHCEYETISLDDAKMLEMCHKSTVKNSPQESVPKDTPINYPSDYEDTVDVRTREYLCQTDGICKPLVTLSGSEETMIDTVGSTDALESCKPEESCPLELVCAQDNVPRYPSIDIQNLNSTFQLPEIQFFEPVRDMAIDETIPPPKTPKKPTERKGRKRIETGLKPKDKQYKCKVCFTWFLTLGELDFHKLSHNPSPPPTCYMCVQRKFSSREQLRDHLREKHVKNKAGIWTCGMCLKEISDVWMYNEHLREHATQFARKGQSQGSLLDMPGCFMQENAVKNFISSIMQHQSKKAIKDENAKSSKEEKRLAGDVSEPEQKTPEAGDPETVKRKVTPGGGNKHSAFTPIEVLSKVESTSKNIEMHPNCKDPSRDCHHCGKQFPKPFKLQRHLVVHNLQKIFMCHKCPVSYQQVSELKDHLKSEHEDVDELDSKHMTLYTCELCADVMHVIKKSFICSTCNYTFSKKEQFDRHMEKHLAGANKIFKFRGVVRPCKPTGSNDDEFSMPQNKKRRVYNEDSQEKGQDCGFTDIVSAHEQNKDTTGPKPIMENHYSSSSTDEQLTKTNNTSVKTEDVAEDLPGVMDETERCRPQLNSAEQDLSTKTKPKEEANEGAYICNSQCTDTKSAGTDTNSTTEYNVKLENDCGGTQTSPSTSYTGIVSEKTTCTNLSDDLDQSSLQNSNEASQSTKDQRTESANDDLSGMINSQRQERLNECSPIKNNENDRVIKQAVQSAGILVQNRADAEENQQCNDKSGSFGATDVADINQIKVSLNPITAEDKDSIKQKKRKSSKTVPSSTRTASPATRENFGIEPKVKKKIRPNAYERLTGQRKADACGNYPVLTSVKDDTASNKIVSKQKTGTLEPQGKRGPSVNFSPKKGEIVRHLNWDCKGKKCAPGRSVHSVASKVSMVSMNNSFNKSRPKQGVRSVESHSNHTAESYNNVLSKLFGQRLTGFKIPLRKDTSESIN